MTTPIIYTKPVDPDRLDGPWDVVYGRSFSTHDNKALADRHADNLREVLITEGVTQ